MFDSESRCCIILHWKRLHRESDKIFLKKERLVHRTSLFEA